MSKPAAKLGDKVLGTDIHIVCVPSPAGELQVPTPHPFSGTLTGSCVNDVLIENKPAATVGSSADNMPPHIPSGGPRFLMPPTNKGTVQMGSTTVLIGGKAAARAGDPVLTCADPAPTPNSKIVVPACQVLIGG